MSMLAHDIPAFASLLQRCGIAKDVNRLRHLHCQAIKLGISCQKFINATFISSYASCAEMSDAHLMFSSTKHKSAFLYNTLIRGYASTKQFHFSLFVFHDLCWSPKTLVDLNTLPAVLKSVAALSFLKLGQQLHSLVWKHGFCFDLAHCNSLISMYGKCGDLWSAREVFNEMRERNMITWCALMVGYGMHGDCEEVFWLFEKMLDSGIAPDEATFMTVLSACSHAGKVDEGKQCFEMMVTKFYLRPSLEHFSCLVDMLGRAGLIEEAKNVIENMEMEPDQALWRSFLGACNKHDKFNITVRGRNFRF